MPTFSSMTIGDTLREVFNVQDAIMGYTGEVMGSAHLHVLFQDGNIMFNSVNERMKGLATSMTFVIWTSGSDGTLK
jgi:hypothetical protein